MQSTIAGRVLEAGKGGTQSFWVTPTMHLKLLLSVSPTGHRGWQGLPSAAPVEETFVSGQDHLQCPSPFRCPAVLRASLLSGSPAGMGVWDGWV